MRRAANLGSKVPCAVLSTHCAASKRLAALKHSKPDGRRRTVFDAQPLSPSWQALNGAMPGDPGPLLDVLNNLMCRTMCWVDRAQAVRQTCQDGENIGL
jgi:hypothetical protein